MMPQDENNSRNLPAMAIIYGTFAAIVITVGNEWSLEQIGFLFTMLTTAYGTYKVLPSRLPSVVRPQKALKDEKEQLEAEIARLLEVEAEHVAVNTALEHVGLRVTVKVAR